MSGERVITYKDTLTDRSLEYSKEEPRRYQALEVVGGSCTSDYSTPHEHVDEHWGME